MTAIAAQQFAARVASARHLRINTRRRRVPNARPPTLIESDYAGRLVAIVDRMRVVFSRVLPDLVGDLPREIRFDDDTAVRARNALEAARAEVGAGLNVTQLEGIADGMAGRVSAHQLADLQRQSRAALGIDVAVLDPRVPDIARGFVRENVALIRKLHSSTFAEIESSVIRAYASGTRAAALGDEISARFGVAERHARLIARDQIGKLTGQITRARHAELGISTYEWQHIGNKNPRPHHVARHGQRFHYDKPPADGHPGVAICCHCLQKPVFDDIYAELDAIETPRARPPIPAVPPAASARPQPPLAGLHAPIVSTRKLGGGINETKLVRYGDGSTAVWKPASGESDLGQAPGVPLGTQYRREAAAYRVARDLGIDVVPESVVRDHKGERGSVQRFVKAKPPFRFKGAIDQDSVEQMRLLDFVSGNIDRHDGNMLIDRRGRAVAIDNGLAFPSGRGGPQQPIASTTPFAGRGLTDATRARIAALDLDTIATSLSEAGLDYEAVRHTLYRAQLLKERPALLEVPKGLSGWNRAEQTDFLADDALRAETSLSAAGKATADAIAARFR